MTKRVVMATAVTLILASTLGCGWWETAGHRKVDIEFNQAVAKGDLAEARRLLDEGADINTRFTKAGGYTTLTMAAGATSYSEGLRFLLEHGADPNVPTNRGQTALMIATSRNNMEHVQLLLDYGADPAIAMPDGSTAMSIAEEKGSTEIAGMLEAAISGGPAS